MRKKPTRILIVDDHPIVRRGLADVISAEPDLTVCGEADEIAAAVQQMKATHPDLVLIDISLKSGSGIELIKQIRALGSDVKMLVLSVHDDALYAERVLQAGGMGYLRKDEAPERLIEAIRRVLGGKIYLSRPMVDRVLERAARGELPQASRIESLTDREMEVFELMGNALTAREIADRLCLSVKTIETYREKMKFKLKARNSTELTRLAVQWVLENT
jgi:DNA-binding NarL/FixJ family response regulator